MKSKKDQPAPVAYDNPTISINDESGVEIEMSNETGNGHTRTHRNSFLGLSEPLPRLDNYRLSQRNAKRPSIGKLHGDRDSREEGEENVEEEPKPTGHTIRLGWVQGVLIPCLLNIWGVMLFLRLSWVVGEAGIVQTLIIIALSYLVCVMTTLSLSAICTNGQVKGGGLYYLISRSLGAEFGASVGIVFAFANSVNAAMNTIGFCSSLNDLLRSLDTKIVDGGVNDIRIVGSIFLLIMIIICAVGMDWEVKAQNFLLVLIVVAIGNFIIGAIIGPGSDDDLGKGFLGLSASLMAANLGSGYTVLNGVQQNFFSVFAIFFPSVTGIQSGANICGDLRDPATAIPKGTLWACLISAISYILFSLMAAGAAVREASGNASDLIEVSFNACAAGNCTYGLLHDYTVMQLISLTSAITYAGCWAATLSTALTNILSVPRLIQALGIDRIYPGLIFFSKGYGKHGEPYRGYGLVFFVSLIFILIADLDAIASLITNLYLASYAFINFCTFHAAVVKPLGWRPTFRYYHPYISLLATILCVAIMFLISVVSSFLAMAIIFVLYLIVVYRQPDANWGSSVQAQAYKTALNATLNLEGTSDHVKNYQPQILAIAGDPMQRPALIDLAHLITKHSALLVIGNIISQRLPYKQRRTLAAMGRSYLKDSHIRGFYKVVDGVDFDQGARCLIQSTGFGRLAPNILMLGFKTNWRTCGQQQLNAYYNTLHTAFDNRLALLIFRMGKGLDIFRGLSQADLYTTVPSPPETTIAVPARKIMARRSLMPVNSNLDLHELMQSARSNQTSPAPTFHAAPTFDFPTPSTMNEPEANLFKQKQPKGTIDVWWLYDDGGLTMLLPYIITTRSKWEKCKIRVFALSSVNIQEEEQNLKLLLDKLRISYLSLTMVKVTDTPKDSTILEHQELLSAVVDYNDDLPIVSESERRQLEIKTNRQLRLRELLLEHSKAASLIVMSMPVPRQDTVSATLYMSWLEMLTKDMPPFLLVRGNQTEAWSHSNGPRKPNEPNIQCPKEHVSVDVPKVAIFTVDDNGDNNITEEIGWSSINLVSGNADLVESNDHLASDALPRLDHYRTSQRAIRRPSIGQLHGDLDEHCTNSNDKSGELPASSGRAVGLGWIEGVLIPCLLNIWGVMLFLRLSWIVALAGILETLLIIGLSYLVCVITALSLSAICTNGQVKGGGIYYLISRSLGPEFGGAVGIVLAFANSVSVSMNTIGFCSSLNQLLNSFGLKIVDGAVNDIRIVGTIVILVMVIICVVDMDWEIKAQNLLVVAIVVAIFSFILGVFVGPQTDVERAKGFAGLSSEQFLANLGPNYRFSEGIQQDFFSVFGIFFPSVTGVQAGANICGELKDPAKAIPKGTLLALLISSLSYIVFVFLAGSASYRDASGIVTDLVNGTFISCRPSSSSSFEVLMRLDTHCPYGLHNDYSIMQLMSISGALIYVGCFAATFSSALTNLLSVPRIIQALGTDRLYPGLTFFAKGYGKCALPYRGYALVFGISMLFLLLANLNLIAPLISNFYLASYALINFCTFHAVTVSPIGWRPTFRYYNQWVSLFGTVLCVLIMFLIDIIATGITMVLICVLYLAVIYRKPDVNWGSTTQAQTYKTALTAALRLRHVGDHVKNYHPSILVLTGNPSTRLPLIDLAHQITKNHALMIVGDVVQERLSYRKREHRSTESRKLMEERKVGAFYRLIDGIGLGQGVRALIQTSGVGKLTPNIVLIGYKADWTVCSEVELQTYYNILNDVFDNRMALTVLRLPDGLDLSHFIVESDTNSGLGLGMPLNESMSSLQPGTDPASSRHTLMYINSLLELQSLPTKQQPRNSSLSVRSSCSMGTATPGYDGSFPQQTLNQQQLFRCKQPKGTIDVWWLYDDGGLTMLIPYILSLRSQWSQCSVRVFALSNQQRPQEEERNNMAHLLAKLRINYCSLTMLADLSQLPQPETVAMHRKLLQHLVDTSSQLTPPKEQSNSWELGILEDKTHRQLRLREMLLEHSSKANLIVMSMPMPRLGTVSAPLYMSWLEMLTKDMPPTLLVRGNQTSVLTFYS
ncbi:bumetanide-sensitive Na-K-Cl cotransport protein [Anopheles darlingi]|uniref:Bumetanide-sensitive Na-K-Cl cotransport protein n=1 Tax=Anopheles darlingi TaxID=43151 RepID=W5JVP7_ANODA|nr:bumetanide-sensitive Na-K-Cl cotransport protein [Anopheles darlingi]